MRTRPVMLSVDHAREEVIRHAQRLTAESLSLTGALGLVLDEPVVAAADQPPFDKSLVDGYAVRISDCVGNGPFRLKLADEIDAGRMPRGSLRSGETALVMTGAPLPEGCDAVVMIEQSERLEADWIELHGRVASGQNRVNRGAEFSVGRRLLAPGATITSTRLGLLAATGCESLRVIPSPRGSIISTGDELVDHGELLEPGQIRNSNGLLLEATFQQMGFPGVRRRVS